MPVWPWQKARPGVDEYGRHPAWYAAMEGRSADLRKHLKQRVSADHADKEGMTMLSVAAFYGKSDCVKLLLEKGADPNLVNRHGNGPLWEATREASQKGMSDHPAFDRSVIEMLLAAGADPNCLNKAGKSPAGWASLSPELQRVYRKFGYQGEFEL